MNSLFSPPARALGRGGYAEIVFNAHYLMYIDTAMMDYWRALALPYEASMDVLGGEMYVKKATVEYHVSAILDDTLDVALRCARVGNSSVLFGRASSGRPVLDRERTGCNVLPTWPPRRRGRCLRRCASCSPTMRPVIRSSPYTWAPGARWAGCGAGAAIGFCGNWASIPAWKRTHRTAQQCTPVLRNALGMPVATGRLLPVGECGAHWSHGCKDAHCVARGGRMVLDALLDGPCAW